ncbi:hydrogenase 4 subunit F [Curtanaerobium respiraculi]|uniref:hydrogenase 4 subunit F n=1 Tax=Curtanaerobium respiraculi TaxID=2949669 RepID=UPI0024B3C397|nr:hydrogenase 4 subunit F [Curtanaerobium respiraculi]
MGLSTLLIALLIAPLAATLVMAVLPKSVSRFAFETIHVMSIAAVLVLSVYLVFEGFTTGEVITAGGMWFRLDALSSIFVILIGVIGVLVGIFSIPYIQHEDDAGKLSGRQVKNYYAFFSLFLFTMLLAATSNNIVMMWICIEATTLATVFLVGCYETKLALEAAWKYVIVCTVGVAFGLYGTLLIYSNAADVMGDSETAIFWTSIVPIAPQLDPTIVTIAFVFAVIGFGTKAGLFPMHTWLPDAHSEAPSPVSALLSGVLLKCAVLVIIRFYIIAVGCIGTQFPQTMLIALGALSVFVAAGAVFVQDDLKRKLAYHSCENIGIVILCLGFGGPVGVAAALLHCVFHGFTKALLFCLSGNVLIKYGTRDLTKVAGVLQVMPTTAVLLTVGFFALAGFPPFAMFTSEMGAFVAGFQGGYLGILVLFALALTVVVAACVHVVATSVFGQAPPDMEKRDMPFLALAPEVILAFVILWFGVALPQPLMTGVNDATGIVMQQDVDPGDTGSLLSGVATLASRN